MAKYHVLVVDDQLEARQVLRAGLETLGPNLRIIDVPSGEEAMLLIPRHAFDLVIADVRLPGITGLELKQRALQYNPYLKLFLVTGVTDPEIKRQVSEAGADAFFFKPVEMPDFLDAVERCLGLVQSVFPAAPPPAVEEKTTAQSVSERLSGLRQELNAFSVVLLDDRGRVLARAGDMPDTADENVLITSLMAAFSVGTKISHFIGMKSPESLLCFTGETYDLYLSHVGQSMALLLVVNTSQENGRNLQVFSAVRPAVQDLLVILANLGVPLDPAEKKLVQDEPEPQAEIMEDEPAPELDKIFGQAGKRSFKPGELDAYWNTAAEESGQDDVINADVISYEQARQLGLAPEDEN